MNEFTGARRAAASLRMDTDMDVLDEWSLTATDVDRIAVYEALFAVAAGTVECDYPVVDDPKRLSEFSVLVRENVELKIRVNCFGSFGVVSVGRVTA